MGGMGERPATASSEAGGRRGGLWLAALTARIQALTYSQASAPIAHFPPPPSPLPTDLAGAHPNGKQKLYNVEI